MLRGASLALRFIPALVFMGSKPSLRGEAGAVKGCVAEDRFMPVLFPSSETLGVLTRIGVLNSLVVGNCV